MDRSRWKDRRLIEAGPPTWPCPECGGAFLVVKEGTLQRAEAASSRKGEGLHSWRFVRRFSCLMQCTACGEVVAVCGDEKLGGVARHGTKIGMTCLYPLFVHPAPPIINVPQRCHDDVKVALVAAFSLSWHDTHAAANRLRSAVEALLTRRGVPRFTSGGRRRRLGITDRIELLRAKDRRLADELDAIKWIGHAGSHSGEDLAFDDLLDGFEILEHALDEAYGESASRRARLVRAIVAKKRPRSVCRRGLKPPPSA